VQFLDNALALIVTPIPAVLQTAALTIKRLPDMPVKAWPIEAFTYLQLACWTARVAPSGRCTSDAIGARPILLIATARGGIKVSMSDADRGARSGARRQ
jgi:hypothetical protein